MIKFLTMAACAMAASAAQAVVLVPVGSPTAAVRDTTVQAWAAAGAFAGNDTGTAAAVADTLDTISHYFGSSVPGGTGAWQLIDKTDSATGTQSYTFTNDPQTTNGMLDFNAPITGWFALTLKSGNQFSMYLFDGGTAGIGAIGFTTDGTNVNKGGTPQALSHASLWVVASPVPEAQTPAMLLAGLSVLAFLSRRKRTA